MADEDWTPDPLYWTQDGKPTDYYLGQAIQVWVALWEITPQNTVGHAAMCFNVTPQRIVAACEDRRFLWIDQTGAMPDWRIHSEGE